MDEKFIFSVLGISWSEWSNINSDILDIFIQETCFISPDAGPATYHKYFVAYVVCEDPQEERRKREEAPK